MGADVPKISFPSRGELRFLSKCTPANQWMGLGGQEPVADGGQHTPEALRGPGVDRCGLTGMQAAVSPPAKPVSILPNSSIQRPRAPAMSA